MYSKSDEILFHDLKKRLASNNNDVEALIELGTLLFVKDSYDESAEYLKRALELEPENPEALFWYARFLYYWHANYEMASDLLKKALKIDRDCTKCILLLASTMHHLGKNPAEYINLLEHAAEIEPDWVSSNIELAKALFELGEFEEAKFVAQKALFLLDKKPSLLFVNSVESYFFHVIMGGDSDLSRKALQELLGRINSKKEGD